LIITKKGQLVIWLIQEIVDAHDAETFSRNGESTDFDSGIFAGREEMAKEILKIIMNDCKFRRVPTGKIEPLEP
jgi:hypothetical protein